MAIIAAPTYNPASAYRPIIWQVFYTAFAPDVITNCRFSVNIGSDSYIGRVAPYQVVQNLGTGAYEYYFYVDVQQYIQRHLTKRGRRSQFGDMFQDTRVLNTDSYCEFEVEFAYEYRNGLTGKIATFPLTDTSGIQYAGITTRQNGDDMGLSEYYGIPAVTTDKPFLTKSPTSRTIGIDENVFLTYWGEWGYCRVRTYDSAGLLLATYYVKTNGGGANKMATMGVGRIQLSAIPLAEWLGGTIPVWVGVASYDIVMGLGVVSGSSITFTANSETRTYVFGDDCSKKLRLYWLNSLGGVDHYDFPYTELAMNVTSDLFQKPLNWPHTQDDYGRARTNIKANRAYNITKLLTNSDMLWIKDLFYSTEVYMLNPDDLSEYWRCWISDTDIIEKRKVGLFEVGFTLNLSQDIVTMRT